MYFKTILCVSMKLRQHPRREVARRPAKLRFAAFTLIELSIVLVVIGLLVGGVLVGLDLIKAAEMRQAISDIEKIDAAALTFRLKYNGLPGDLRNATNFFSECAPTDTVAGGIPNACNGNGDKVIGARDLSSSRVAASSEAGLRVWEHLSLSGLIEGNYTGAAGSARVAGVNSFQADWLDKNKNFLPTSEVYTGVSAQIIYHYPCLLDVQQGCEAGQAYLSLNTSSGHRIIFAAIRPANKEHELSITEGLNATFVKDFDTKIDDGKPLSGKVRAIMRNGYVRNCTNGTSDKTQDYNLTTYPSCRMMVDLGF